jgi:hypothetical protein
MYYPDLTPYVYYQKFGTLVPILHDPNTLNVGWLDRTQPYPQGETSEEFQDRLFEFCQSPVMVTRGVHQCSFCEFRGKTARGGKELWLGHAEIRVIGKGRKIYAAPTLVYHYVVAHKYLPPDEFIQALLEGPLPGSPEYEAVKKGKGWE